MSELKRLIKKLCPDGVEWKTIKEICNIYSGGDVPKENFSKTKTDVYNIPVISNGIGNNALYGYTNINKITEEAVTVSARGTIGYAEYRNYSYFPVIRLLSVIPKNKIYLNTKYLYYVLQKQNYNIPKAGIPQLTSPIMQKISIPVPPIEIQREIVRILDKYSEKVTALQHELEKEFELRKKQYAYYLNKLLTFGDDIEWKTISEVADNFTGLTYKPTDTGSDGTLVLRSTNILNNRLVFKNNVFVKMDNIPERAIAKGNDILICVRNGSRDLIGKSAIIPKTNEKMAFGAFMTVLRAKETINYKFLFYIWQSYSVQKQLCGNNAMPINQITSKDFSRIKIPVPPIEEQERIIKILDKFDNLCNDLTSGIPAEIEARKKQYEYYRNKLLQFN
ncbi:MAG: restriction endonuclease subunit S [Ruminococcus sp.]|nr:restriction endonuclease subunit S [Ruminococcus sp.]